MSSLIERLRESIDFLHDEGFARDKRPIVDMVAAIAELERLGAELAATKEAFMAERMSWAEHVANRVPR